MDWQFVVVGIIIGIAAFFVGRRFFNKIVAARKNAACDIECGCDSKSKGVFAKHNRN